ncbi:hypothetical protein LNP25_22830 [Klebsiella variicola subsp. variicola]|nr:hypothetical protein [Klebsiella variicola subsp. variicola]
MPDCPNEKRVTVLVTVLGNLIENALDAIAGGQAEGEIGLLLHCQDGWLSGEVSDDGPGSRKIISTLSLTKVSPPKARIVASGCFSPTSSCASLAAPSPSSRNPAYYPIFVHLLG